MFSCSNVQVVEITKGSKVKYELDKKTGLIKVWKTIHPSNIEDPRHVPELTIEGHTSWAKASPSPKQFQFCPVYQNICHHFLLFKWISGWSSFIFFSGLSSQLWFHPSHTMWRQWSLGLFGYHAGEIPIWSSSIRLQFIWWWTIMLKDKILLCCWYDSVFIKWETLFCF